jgi:hypothetical protein
MGLEQASGQEIVDKAVGHKWGIPEFQRNFVWTPQKVRDLVDSLWRGYPVGSFLVWYSQDDVEPKTEEDEASPGAWVVDGQQRTTALCLLLGRKPYWWDADWNKALEHHDVRFNVLAEDEPFFSLKSAAMKGQAAIPWVSVRKVLNADDDALADLIQGLIEGLDLPQKSYGTFWTKLDAVRKVRDVTIPVLTVTLDLEDVTEIFSRLNSAGTKVTEADIALALAASQNPGWARTAFLPFLVQLKEAGFDIDPNLVFRSAVAIGLGTARLKQVPRSYWTGPELRESWTRTQRSWRETIRYVSPRGILNAEVLPTKNALIPLSLVVDRFSDALVDGRPLAWLLHATRSQRYGGSAITALEKDVRLIREASSAADAFEQMRAGMGPWVPFTADDFLSDYRDRVTRLVLYLVMYSRGAHDWKSRLRIGFEGKTLLEAFNPDWHHIFPRAYLRDQGIPEERWNVFANIAVIDPASNKGFSAKAPQDYIAEYNITPEFLAEQLVPDPSALTIERFDEFVNSRAQALADAANEYMAALEA